MRRWTAVALLMVMLVATACSKAKGPAPEKAGEKQAQPAGPVTLRIMTFYDHGQFDVLISAFYAKNPDIRVVKVPADYTGNYQPADDYYKESIQAHEVDLVQVLGSSRGFSSQLLDLEPFIQKSRFDLGTIAADLDTLRVDGHLRELPYTVLPWVVYYNQDTFSKTGVAEPKPGWTWDQFREAAARVARGSGASVGVPGNYLAEAFSLQVAGQLVPSDDAAVKDLYQLLGTMIQTDQSVPKAGTPSSPDAFFQGKIPLYLSPYFRVAGNLGFHVVVAPLPVRAGTKTPAFTWATRLAIAGNTTVPDAAWRFLRFAAGPEGAEVLARAGFIPLTRSETAKKAWLESHPPQTGFLFDTTWRVMNNEQITPGNAQAVQAFDKNLKAVLSGDKPWDVAYADYQTAVSTGK